jgi:hypothetical protein
MIILHKFRKKFFQFCHYDVKKVNYSEEGIEFHTKFIYFSSIVQQKIEVSLKISTNK